MCKTCGGHLSVVMVNGDKQVELPCPECDKESPEYSSFVKDECDCYFATLSWPIYKDAPVARGLWFDNNTPYPFEKYDYIKTKKSRYYRLVCVRCGLITRLEV